MIIEPKAAKRSGAAEPFLDCPTKTMPALTPNTPGKPQLPSPKAFFGFLARFFGPQRNGLDGVRGAPAALFTLPV